MTAVDKSDKKKEVLSFDYGPPPPTFTDLMDERQHVKEQLALAFRILAREGMCEGISGHLTSRDPIDRESFWVNPYGLHFSRMTVTDLLLIDHKGKIIAGGRPERQRYNAAAFVIHSAIHAARPDVNSVCHAHTPSGRAFSTLGKPLPFYTQDSAIFWNDIGHYAEHGGVVLATSESDAIVKSMGSRKALVMQNHGILTVGGCIETAMAWFMLLENECKCVLAAEAAAAMTGSKPISLQPDVAEFSWRETGTEEAGRFEGLPFFDLMAEECKDAHKA